MDYLWKYDSTNPKSPWLLHISKKDSSLQISMFDKIKKGEGFWASVTKKECNISISDTIETNDSTYLEYEKDIDENEVYRGIKVYKRDLPFSKYTLLPISDKEFNSLSFEDRLKVANKLLATLYYGFPQKELEKMINSKNFISTIQKSIYQKSPNFEEVEKLLANKEVYKSHCECSMKALARLFHLKFGREFVDRWMAYVLNQTILFSPAYELDTVSSENICNVNAELINGFTDHYSMRFLTFLHTTSENNWRRFRSPEDNGREMLEIYNMDFNDSHVPIAARALQNWKLEGSRNTLIIGPNRNYKALQLFDTTIYNGIDFYAALVKYKEFVPTIVKRLVNIYFPYFSKEKKSNVVTKILQSHPETFQDVLLQIVFSKEYLLNSKKYMSAEERYLSLAKKMGMVGEGYYYFVSIRKDLEKMHQASMIYKLGRTDTIPKDTYSVTIYKNFIRSYILDPIRGEGQWGWQPKVVIEDGFGKEPKEDLDGYIEYLFRYILSRKPLDKEIEVIKKVIKETRTSDRLNITNIIFSYIIKLSEFYRFDKVGL